MTDPIPTAKADRDRLAAIKAKLFDGIDPSTALAAALDLLLVRGEDVDGLRAEVERLTEERDQARCAARDNAHQHERLLEERDTLQRAIARIVTCPPEEEHAAMAAARLLVGEEAIARYVGATTKPEARPVATVELARAEPTAAAPSRYAAVSEIPSGTPAVWLGLGDSSDHVAATMNASGPGRFVWSTKPPPWAFGAIIDTTPGAPGGPVDVDAADLGLVYAVGWTDAQRASPGLDVRTYDPASWAAVIRRLAELHPDVPAGRLRVVVRSAAKDGGQ